MSAIARETLALLEAHKVPAHIVAFLEATDGIYIGGELYAGPTVLDVFEPSTGGRLAQIGAASPVEVDRAFEAAHRAFPAWRDSKPSEREAALLRLADLIEENADDLAIIETLDNGKALGPCREIDILGGADLVRYMAGMARHIDGSTRSVSAPGNAITMTVKEAIGVVSAIVPWNWPFNMSMWKLAAPLAAGCTVVLKTAQQTPLSMMYFTHLIKQAGFPDGVINIVSGKGSEIGDTMVSHRLADKVSFTGSTPIGRRVGTLAGETLSPVTLELGGKSPMLAFEDADLDKLVETTRWSVFFNAGQVCTAGSRLYVHRSRLDDVLAKLRLLVESMKLAPGLDADCEMGPVISGQAQRDIEGYVERARAAGVRLVAQGQNVPDHGWFVPPIVLLADDNQAEIVQEEVFGPVLVVLPFDNEEDAVTMANDNEYGLAASIWTQNIDRAMRLIGKIDAGTVWVNSHDLVDSALPIGGFKASGFGKDMGPEQFEQYLRVKSVWIDIAASVPDKATEI